MAKPSDTTGNKDPMESQPSDDFLIVGIGASAGGISALKEFFSHVPANSGNAYVVILHLSPSHESHLPEVLQPSSNLPVVRIDDEVIHVKPDHVYVIPPNRSLAMTDGTLEASEITRQEERRAPVDIFFRTLAESKDTRAVSVILSGTGSDGSMGVKRVKEKGGIIIAQDPGEAEYPDMPLNTISTGLVDYVLPVAEMPRKIIEYRDHLGKAEIAIDGDESSDTSDETALYDIFVTMRARTGHDFINYKRATVLRRIERRMNVNHVTRLHEYSEFLRDSRDEAAALLKDLLISVTNFFRDAAPFEYLEREIVPAILRGKKNGDTVRVWVAGCASGEEAYSIAMLFAEQTHGRLNVPAVQIFATDIDNSAISIARSAIYSESDVADVSPERLTNFFVAEGDHYRVRRELRELVLFANHNIIKDPPFSKLDLFTCRNLLIYLNRTAQRRVMETAHFALNPGGYLFVGASETPETEDNLFTPVDKDLRIYRRRQSNARAVLSLSTFAPTVPQTFKHFTETHRHEELRALERLSYTALHQQLLEEYAAPSVVVNAEYDILHMSDSAGRYMQMVGGEPTKNLLAIARPELRIELRSALYQSLQKRAAVSTNGISVNTDSGPENIKIHVRPAFRDGDPEKGYLLVLFEPAADLESERPSPIDENEPLTRQLEEELIFTKSQLRATVEQYEVQHEELRASNEELQAINEELRSAVEEIETGKEELQSVNEELSTVNQELKIKIEELSQSNNDFQNLINSSQVGTIFLDRALRVKMFTGPAAEVFNLIPGDVGRPLSDLATRLKYDDFIKDVNDVLAALQPIERLISDDDGRTFLVRTIPYRTSDDLIDGVVLTFVDISKRLRDEAELLRAEQRLENALNIETVGVIFYNDELQIEDCNDTFLKMTGLTRNDINTGIGWKDLSPPEWYNVSQKAYDDLRVSGYATPYEKECVAKDGSRFWGVFAPARIGDNEIVEYVIDISSQKRAEKDVRFQLRLLDVVDQAMIATDVNGVVTYWNPAAEVLYGWSKEEAVGRPITSLTTPKTSVQKAAEIMEQLRNGKSWSGEFEVMRRDGSTFLAHVHNSPMLDKNNQVIGIVGVTTDISFQRRTEVALRESEDRTRILVESATDYAIFTISAENIVTSWSPGAENVFGFSEDEIVGKSGEILFTEEDRLAGVPQKEMENARATGRAEDERWHRRKDGSRFFASGVMQPLRSDGEPGFVKICRDQTEKLAAEEAGRERQTMQRVIRTQEDERRRIARDLHDTLGQQLTALRLKLEAVKANYGAEPAMMKAIDETQLMAKQIDDDISFLNWELRPTALDNLGLRNALANYVEEWSKNFEIPAEFHTSRARNFRLEPETEINLYRIAQEALNNVMKHARAKKVSVLLEMNKGNAVLVIEDDGIGFRPDRRTRRTESGKGLGLVGMRERAALIGGKLTIESARGKGTTVIARVPVKPLRPASGRKA